MRVMWGKIVYEVSDVGDNQKQTDLINFLELSTDCDIIGESGPGV